MRWNRIIRALHIKRNYALVLMTAGMGITLSVSAFIIVWDWERREIEDHFDRTAGGTALALESSIAANVEAPQDIRSLYDASIQVYPQEFRSFTAYDLGEHPSIQALECIPRVPASERMAYEEDARKEGFPGFRVVERETQGTMVPAGGREDGHPARLGLFDNLFIGGSCQPQVSGMDGFMP